MNKSERKINQSLNYEVSNCVYLIQYKQKFNSPEYNCSEKLDKRTTEKKGKSILLKELAHSTVDWTDNHRKEGQALGISQIVLYYLIK